MLKISETFKSRYKRSEVQRCPRWQLFDENIHSALLIHSACLLYALDVLLRKYTLANRTTGSGSHLS
jgi:hypothetical protein